MMTTKQKMILVTGGTGQTGERIARRLTHLGYPVRTASRKIIPLEGTSIEHVRFDWNDETTYGPALEDVEKVYLVAPVLVADPTSQMMAFLDLALKSGVRRVVLLSSSAVLEDDGPVFGKVQRAIRERAPEWAILHPSWFMQNFIQTHAAMINHDGVMITATGGNARVGFVDADDIAEVAVCSLTDKKPHNTSHVITGPEALSYSEVADIIGSIVAREIKHVDISTEKLRDMMVGVGMPEDYASILAGMEEGIRNGLEDRVTDTVERVTGRAPRSLRDFVVANSSVWDI
ncbi:ergot alkaloid biosynthesis protein [Baia soyae]|uniref:Ergot alkaloid biosynthesis protein n=1 Tax=Baia soyae TaxID=1544746 RepID=A0A4V2SXJ9_9BACL|nr:ergot alkaloid biosynthesis protein [Baia soyae]TCP66546.1 ergot alkaloid biosynthesis protein [Baia soyae]